MGNAIEQCTPGMCTRDERLDNMEKRLDAVLSQLEKQAPTPPPQIVIPAEPQAKPQNSCQAHS